LSGWVTASGLPCEIRPDASNGLAKPGISVLYTQILRVICSKIHDYQSTSSSESFLLQERLSTSTKLAIVCSSSVNISSPSLLSSTLIFVDLVRPYFSIVTLVIVTLNSSVL